MYIINIIKHLMLKMWENIIIISIFFKFCLTNEASYEGYKLYGLRGINDTQRDQVLELFKNVKYDFFVLPTYEKKKSHVLVAPKDQETFENTLLNYQINFRIINSNVGADLKTRTPQNTQLRINATFKPSEQFMTYNEINKYLDSLAVEYPNIVNVSVAGKSFEQNDIKYVKIVDKSIDNSVERRIIVIEAGAHSREWTSIATALHFMYNLLVRRENVEYLFAYEWIIIPISNPDGYIYSHTTDRLWRKTRRPINQTGCIGTDINHNFGFFWDRDSMSSNPCHVYYKGDHEFSEPETATISNLLLAYKDRILVFISLHDYGSYILYPWAHTNIQPKFFGMDHILAVDAISTIRSITGHRYSTGSVAWHLYESSGTIIDYAFGIIRVPYCFMILARGKPGYTFHPPNSEIPYIAEEAWIATRTIIKGLFYNPSFKMLSFANKYFFSWHIIIIDSCIIVCFNLCHI